MSWAAALATSGAGPESFTAANAADRSEDEARARAAAMAPGPTGLHPYLDNLVRLSSLDPWLG